jgi:hypothetical protein
MGYRKIKRPILAPNGLEVTGASTFSGVATFTAAPVLSGVGLDQNLQTLSSDSTGTTINSYGITTIWQTIDGTTNQTFKLAAPTAGVEKTILVEPGLRTVTITSTATGTDPFYGSTDTTSLVVTSDASDLEIACIRLAGVTSLQTGATGTKWAVLTMTTAISIT